MGRWTENGRELYTLAKDYGLKLQNTFGPRRAEQWTWQHPQGGRHRIDCFCVRLATRETPARPICKVLVACSGFRDHRQHDRPLVMLSPVTAIFKRKKDTLKQLAWDRTRLCDALAAWQDWKRTYDIARESAPRDSLVEQALLFQHDLLTPMQAFNMIEHALVEVCLRYFCCSVSTWRTPPAQP